MATGIFLNLMVGVVWAGIGIVMSLVAGRRYAIFAYYAAAQGCAAVFMWLFVVRWSVVFAETAKLGELAWWMGLGGLLNALAQALIIGAMRRGHMGVTWTITQSAMAVPFLLAFFVWDDPLAPTSWVGLGSILVAIALMARERPTSPTPGSRTWLPMALLGFVAVAVSQTSWTIPSRWTDWSDVARIRPALSLTVGTMFHAALACARRERLSLPVIRLGLLWSGCAIFSHLGLFACLDIMTRHGLAGIVFPVGVSTCVVLFSVYSKIRLREEYTRWTVVALGLGVGGILLMAADRLGP